MKGTVGVFERYSLPQSSHPLRTWLKTLRGREISFRTAVVVSIIVHAALGLALILVPVNLGEHLPEKETVALQRAVEDVADDRPNDPEMAAFLTEAGRSGLLADLQKIKVRGTGFADGMKTEVYKAILKASLAAQGKSLMDLLRENPKLVLPDGSQAFVSGADRDLSSLTLSVLPRRDLAAMQEAARFAELRRTEKGYLADGNLVRVQTPKGNVIVPDDYFFRKCPYEKILSWGADLFFFSTDFPLDLRGPAGAGPGAAVPADAGRESPENRPSSTVSDPGLIRMFLIRPSRTGRVSARTGAAGEAASRAAAGPDDRARDKAAILDKLMPLPENDQVTAFIRDHLEGADPDSPETAALAGAFFQNNLNTIIFDITELAAAFDCLEELYFNKVLAFRIAGLWDSLRETRTGTECLLYFASQYDFERRALERLLAAQTEAEAFLDGRSAKAELYKKERKCQVVRDVGRKVLAEMKRRGYAAPADILNAYRREQERIYDYLIERGGEGRDRGLFALGCYYWDLERFDFALRTWMEIRPSHDHPTFIKIRGILSGAESHDVKMMRIHNVLVWEDLSGSDEFLLRLVKFGKWRNRSG